MENNYELMSTKELKDLYLDVENDFKEKQKTLKNVYDSMILLSEQALAIKNIIKKRGGNL